MHRNKKMIFFFFIIIILTFSYVYFAMPIDEEDLTGKAGWSIFRRSRTRTPTPRVVSFGCTDSDGGQNYYTKGTATRTSIYSDGSKRNVGRAMTDKCRTPRDLIEFGCENNYPRPYNYVCSEKCIDGACVGGPKTYKDADAYIGESLTDPQWIWNLNIVETNKMSVGIENDFVKDDFSDNPITYNGCYTLPENYAKLCMYPKNESAAKVEIKTGNDNYFKYNTGWSGDLDVTIGVTAGNGIRKSLGYYCSRSWYTDCLVKHPSDGGVIRLYNIDSPSIENAQTSSETEYGDDMYMEVLKKSITYVYPENLSASDVPKTINFLGKPLTITEIDVDPVTPSITVE